MDLVAVDWFKDTTRIDHVARRKGCAAQVRDTILLKFLLKGDINIPFPVLLLIA